jgi:hypothetical protein
MRPRAKQQYGQFAFAGGRKIEVVSDFQEWTDWAVAVLDAAAEAEKKKGNANDADPLPPTH